MTISLGNSWQWSPLLSMRRSQTVSRWNSIIPPAALLALGIPLGLLFGRVGAAWLADHAEASFRRSTREDVQPVIYSADPIPCTLEASADPRPLCLAPPVDPLLPIPLAREPEYPDTNRAAPP